MHPWEFLGNVSMGMYPWEFLGNASMGIHMGMHPWECIHGNVSMGIPWQCIHGNASMGIPWECRVHKLPTARPEAVRTEGRAVLCTSCSNPKPCKCISAFSPAVEWLQPLLLSSPVLLFHDLGLSLLHTLEGKAIWSQHRIWMILWTIPLKSCSGEALQGDEPKLSTEGKCRRFL